MDRPRGDPPLTASAPEGDGPPSPPRPRGVTLRAVALGLAFIAALAFLLPYLSEVRSGPDLGLSPITGASVLTLLVVLGPINLTLRWLRRRWELSRPEILTVYAMVALVAALSTTGYAQLMSVMVTASQYYATPENRWDILIQPHIPTWLQLNDPLAVRWLWEGLPEHTRIPWAAWRSPMLAWGGIAFCIYVGSFSLLSLVRRDWIESQRLAFPLAQIPLDLVGEKGVPGSALLRVGTFWIGFGIAGGYGLLGLLNAFFPSVPYFVMSWPIGRSFDANVMPWGVLNRLEFNLSWSGLGIMCLLPVEVSLSLWLFHVWYNLEQFALASAGITGGNNARYSFDPGAFFSYQTAGARVGFGLLALYQSRRAILAALRSWADPAYREDDPLDLLKPRYALLAFLLSLVGLALIARAAGAQLDRLLVLMFCYYTTAISLTRVIAAAGTNHVECGPQMRYLLDYGLGTIGARPASFVLYNQMDAVFMTEFKSAFMHYAANDMKLLHASRVRGTSVVLALTAAVVLMLTLGPIGKLWADYQVGVGAFGGWFYDAVPRWEFGDMVDFLQNPRGPDWMGLTAMASGGLLVTLLNALQMTVSWWRLSPIGLLLQGGYGINAIIWANALVGWCLVNLIYRFGGLRLYQRLRPAFIGLFLGSMTATLLSSAVRLLAGTPGR